MIAGSAQKRLNWYDEQLADVHNLTDALQIVAWDLTQQDLKERPELNRLRNAVVGIANALEAIVTKEEPNGD